MYEYSRKNPMITHGLIPLYGSLSLLSLRVTVVEVVDIDVADSATQSTWFGRHALHLNSRTSS